LASASTSRKCHVRINAAIRIARERRGLASHLWFYPGEPLAPGVLYATVLREPIQRFLSQYAFYRGHQLTSPTGGWSSGTSSRPSISIRRVPARSLARTQLRQHQAAHFAWRVCDAPSGSAAALFEAAVTASKSTTWSACRVTCRRS